MLASSFLFHMHVRYIDCFIYVFPLRLNSENLCVSSKLFLTDITVSAK